MKLKMISHLPAQHREALENLLFFNPRQHRIRLGIERSIEKYGAPRIYEQNGHLSLCTERFSDFQYLYALDESKKSVVLAGVLIFVREKNNTLEALHVAAAHSYLVSECSLEESVVYQLIQTLLKIGNRLRGIEQVGVSCYRSKRRYFCVKAPVSKDA